MDTAAIARHYTAGLVGFDQSIDLYRTTERGVCMMDSSSTKLQDLSLEQLRFDLENPRLPSHLRGVTNETEILTHMLRDESLLELMASIGETGYSTSEPLLVTSNGDGTFCVVEGNRRLAALRLLQNHHLATFRKKSVEALALSKKVSSEKIPAFVYASRNDILDYLGYRHITGVKSWGALEKARYLKQLYDRHKTSDTQNTVFTILAKMIGSRSDYVGKLLSSLNLFEYAEEQAYFGIEIDEMSFDFSILSTAVSYENTYKFVGLESTGDLNGEHINKDNYKFLFTSIFGPDKKIRDSRELKDLNAVIGSKNAIEKLKNGCSLSEALFFTSAPYETFGVFLQNSVNALKKAKDGIEQLTFTKEEITPLINELDKITKLAISIKGSLTALLEGDETTPVH